MFLVLVYVCVMLLLRRCQNIKLHLFTSKILNKESKLISSCLASCPFCRLLVTFADSLDADQDLQNVGPDLDQNNLTL